MRADIYRNLHKDCYSIRGVKSRKVIGYSQFFLLNFCKFRVQEGGRQRVIKNKRKNVHAFIRGVILWDDEENVKRWMKLESTPHKITYNPYKFSSFVDVDCGYKPCFAAAYIAGTPDGLFGYGIGYGE